MILGVLALGLILATAPAEAPKAEAVTLSGTVVELPAALKALGLKADTEPIAGQVVLKGDDGTITPLLPDEASRAFFKDPQLRDRRAEIKGRRLAGLPYLQVTSFKVEHEGKLRTPEYYCDVCTISERYPQTCPCCQGPMVLRMRPESD
ncbi:MAG: hypothetical protein IRY99_02960 [Isosphaeraceae bacterium]|nr:hypothetical protein [Isosphaeraceae bacterium]